MSQSAVIFFSLVLAFVIYVTLKGELPSYVGILTGANTGAGTSNNTVGLNGIGTGSSVTPAPTGGLNYGAIANELGQIGSGSNGSLPTPPVGTGQ